MVSFVKVGSLSHTFFNETNEFLSVLSIFIFQLSQNLVLYIYTHNAAEHWQVL